MSSVIRLTNSNMSLRATLFNKVMEGALKAILDHESKAEHFLELPSREDFPDYYEVILEPMAISTIQGKIKKRQYTTLQELKEDFDAIIDNANHYNKKSSAIVRDALALKEVFEEALDALMKEHGLDLSSEIDGTKAASRSSSKADMSPLRDVVEKLIAYKNRVWVSFWS